MLLGPEEVIKKFLKQVTTKEFFVFVFLATQLVLKTFNKNEAYISGQ